MTLLAAGVLALGASVAVGGWSVGDALPSLEDKGLTGDLPALAGHVVVVDFWASWCAPCRKSFSELDALYAQHREQGLVVLGISVDDEQAHMGKFLAKYPVTFPTVWDSKHAVAAMAELPGMPSSYVIDRSGKIRFAHTGFHGDKTAQAYREEIEQLLKEGGGDAP